MAWGEGHFLMCSDTVSKCSRVQRKIVPLVFYPDLLFGAFSATSHVQSSSIILKRRQTFQIIPKRLWKQRTKSTTEENICFLTLGCPFKLVCKYCWDSFHSSLRFDALFCISSYTFLFCVWEFLLCFFFSFVGGSCFVKQKVSSKLILKNCKNTSVYNVSVPDQQTKICSLQLLFEREIQSELNWIWETKLMRQLLSMGLIAGTPKYPATQIVTKPELSSNRDTLKIWCDRRKRWPIKLDFIFFSEI